MPPLEPHRPLVSLASPSRRVWALTLRRTPIMRGPVKSLAVFVMALLVPTFAYAQATLTGTVRDSSGSVLPGVTVEASSPALIEKTKTAVTDGAGQYRIVDLRAGTYRLTFTLSGFNTVVREN